MNFSLARPSSPVSPPSPLVAARVGRRRDARAWSRQSPAAMAPEGQPRKRRVPFAERTLLCFVQALVGTKVVVELRDDVAIRGVLADVDDRMNLTIENAQRRTPEGVLMKLERVYVSARTVRYVHVPPSVDPSELVERKRLEAFEASRHYQRQAAFGPRNPSKGEREEARRRAAER